MNKRGLRTFSLGIIFTVSILGTYYFYFANQNQTKFSDTAAKKQLVKNGYIVLTSADYQKIKKSSADNPTAAKKTGAEKTANRQNSTVNKNQVITYQLNVVSGMSSDEIAKLLADHKIIENRDEFGRFLISHQFQSNIQLGTYHLTDKMNYEEIAKLITK